MNKIYKLTPMESSFVILLALDKLRPRQLNEALECYVEHRREVTLVELGLG